MNLSLSIGLCLLGGYSGETRTRHLQHRSVICTNTSDVALYSVFWSMSWSRTRDDEIAECGLLCADIVEDVVYLNRYKYSKVSSR